MAQVVIHSRTQFIQSVLNIDLAWAEAEIEKGKKTQLLLGFELTTLRARIQSHYLLSHQYFLSL